ncbi:MAG: extracellular solute-binding protein [Pseudomonadales bacterium]|nr:extracellular solute-binding protein [Pseudomonadales bacterium]
MKLSSTLYKSVTSIVLASGLAAFCTGALAEGKVVVYNWTEYIPEGITDEFTKETGIEVDYNTYESNEVMYSKIKLQKASGYDVIVPSTYYISKMAQEGLLAPIDKTQLNNLKNLDPALLDKPYDPENKHSIPYTWGSTGIGINVSDIDPASITGWQDLWDTKWKNSLLLTDDVREVFHIALAVNGHSANSTDPGELKQAFESLQKLMPNVLVFNSDAPREPFMAGDVSLGMIWNGEVIMAQEEDDNIQYIYPKEGAAFWVDSFAIPANAENKENAHKFIDFMLRPEIAKRCIEYTGYALPNTPAIAMLDEKTRNNKTIFPPEEIIAKGEFQKDVGKAIEIYNQYWEQLKTGR